MGWNPLYEYSQGINFLQLSGKVMREVRIAGKKGREFAWFRMCVLNQDNPGQKLFISVRSRGALAHHVWENIAMGDEVAICGRIWSMRMFKSFREGEPKVWRQVIYVDAERVSGSYPVQLDYDSRYLRIRIDLWNRMCKMIPEAAAEEVPYRARKDLMAVWDEVAEWYRDVTDEVDEDAGDPDPSSNKEPTDDDDASECSDR